MILFQFVQLNKPKPKSNLKKNILLKKSLLIHQYQSNETKLKTLNISQHKPESTP